LPAVACILERYVTSGSRLRRAYLHAKRGQALAYEGGKTVSAFSGHGLFSRRAEANARDPSECRRLSASGPARWAMSPLASTRAEDALGLSGFVPVT